MERRRTRCNEDLCSSGICKEYSAPAPGPSKGLVIGSTLGVRLSSTRSGLTGAFPAISLLD
jgi:hypothetical protein